MTRTDPELRAVLDLPAAEPTDASVSRTWHLLNKRHIAGRSRAPRRLSRLLIPVSAAAVVAAIAAGAILLNGPGDGNAQVGGPNTAEVLASHQPLPTERGTNPSLPRTTPEAIAALDELAHTAESATAVTLGPGQLVHVRSDGWGAAYRGDEPTARIGYQGQELWIDPQGMIAVRVLTDGRDMADGPKADPQPGQAERDDLRQNGANLRRATPEWLAQLPAADPAALLARLRDDVDDNDQWTADHMVWDAMAELYFNADLLLSPQLRAGLLRAFRGMDGLTAGEVVVDGWRLIAIRQTDRRAGIEILFDPLTASAVGRRTMYADSEITLIPPDGGPRFDPLVGSHATWTQHLVNSTDER